MESGNTSGSLQSSSGDEQEYDSRAQTTSSNYFINNSTTTYNYNNNNNNNNTGGGGGGGGNNTTNNSSSSSSHVGPPLSMFDPLSNFFDQNNTIWSKTLRSEPGDNNCTDFTGFMAATSSTSVPTQQFFTHRPPPSHSHSHSHDVMLGTTTTSSSMQFPVSNINNSSNSNNKESVSGPTTTTTNNNIDVVVRNPKKRSRASRRAPTTVLTTDTSNFRAMVQEFTGIPAPPFTSTLFPRTTNSSTSSRLDLFGGRSTNFDINPLLRPFAHKPTLNHFINNTNNTNYQQPHNLLNNNNITSNMQQNPFLNFQPLLQPNNNSKIYPLNKQTSVINPSSNDIILQSQSQSQTHDQFGLQVGSGGEGNYGNSNNDQGSDQQLLRSINVNLSSSDFHLDKGPTTTTTTANVTRSEGMVESWICSSD
ncbi:hypothetical protein ACFE04_017019 [Oxalis oulophora]